MTTTARPRDAAELAVLLPYQLGYHPGPSVCLTLMHGRRLGMIQRHDLSVDPRACRDTAQEAVAIAAREGATSVLLMAFEDDEGESLPLRVAMTSAALEVEIPVHEQLVVRDGRCSSPDGDARDRSWRVLPRPEDVPAIAHFVQAGVCPLPSRDHLVRGVLPERDEVRAAAVSTASSPLGVRRTVEDLVLVWARLLDPSHDARGVEEMTDADLLLLASSLQDIDWRDALMAVLCPGALPLTAVAGRDIDRALLAGAWCPWVVGDDALGDPDLSDAGEHHDDVRAVRNRLVDLTRLVPIDLAPPVLTCVAHLAWWSGDGTVAGICLERALQIDPDYRLAGLMLQLLAHGVRPWAGRSAA